MAQRFDDVDAYIDSFPAEVQDVLKELRRLIRESVPDAVEAISYQIPTYKVEDKAFVYFAGWKTHVSLYPIPPLEQPLETEVAAYRSGKDTVRFPLSEPLPTDLVSRIVSAMREAGEGARR